MSAAQGDLHRGAPTPDLHAGRSGPACVQSKVTQHHQRQPVIASLPVCPDKTQHASPGARAN